MEQIDKLQSQILEHKSYLFSTDYVVLRNQETSQDIPEEIKEMRRLARAEINRLEAEIAELKKQINEQSDNVQL